MYKFNRFGVNSILVFTYEIVTSILLIKSNQFKHNVMMNFNLLEYFTNNL